MTNPTPAAEVPTDEHYCLAEVDRFRDLSRREMAALVTGAPQRTVSAGRVVYSPLRPTAVLFIVKRGRIRLHHLTPDGRSITTAVLGPGTVFGEMDLIGLRMRATWAEALQPSQLCLMSRTDVQQLLFTDPRIALRIAEHLNVRIAYLEQRLTDLTCKTLDERLAATLCQLARHTPAEPVRLIHQQLAALVGATRERAGGLLLCGLVSRVGLLVSGLLGGGLAAVVVASRGYNGAYITAGMIALLAAGLSLLLRRPSGASGSLAG